MTDWRGCAKAGAWLTIDPQAIAACFTKQTADFDYAIGDWE